MTEYICKRCGIEFKQKIILIKHLQKKTICLPIENDIDPVLLIEQLNKKDGVQCTKCNKIYKNNNSLRAHNCKSFQKSIENNKGQFEFLNQKIDEMSKLIIELTKNPQVINNTTNNINNTNIININCLMDTSGKPIDYLLSQDNVTDLILGWMKLNQKLIPTYMKEKYYNIEHPENHMIRAGQDGNSIELYIQGKWKKYENIKGADLILTNIGNDFGLFLEILKANPELYTEKKKILTQFEKDIIKPLNWGLEISDDSGDEECFQIIKNEKGEFTTAEDEQNRIKSIELHDIAVNQVHRTK